MGVRFLGKIPIEPEIVSSGDEGKPFVWEQRDSQAVKAFNEMVDHPTIDYITSMHDPDEMEGVKREEITFLDKRKKIISVLLMEAFKSNDKNHFLFQCAELIINQERKELMKKFDQQKKASMDDDLFFIFEFCIFR